MRYFFILFFMLPMFASADSSIKEANAHKFSHNKLATKSFGSVNEFKTNQHYIHHNKLNDIYLINKIFINVEGIDFKGDLSFLYKEYLNEYVGNPQIMELSKKIARHFIEQDYLLPQITIKEEDLAKGIISFRVRIESLRDVIILGKADNLMQVYAKKILEVKPTKLKHTQHYIALMNKIPGVNVVYKLREDVQDELNKKESNIDLVLVNEASKGEAFANIDNYGVNDLGKAQAVGNVQFFSPFNRSDDLSLSAFTTNHPDRLYDVGIKYSFPINNLGTRGYFMASHAEDNPTRSFAIAAKNSQQNSFSIFVTHPLYLTASKELFIRKGFNYKTLANYGVVNNNITEKTDSSKYWSGDIGLEYLFKDGFQASNIFQVDFTKGLDGKFHNYQDPTNIANKHFNNVKFNIYREQPLANNFSVYSHFAASYSNKALPDQELSCLGGRIFGRGYEFCTLDGSKMVALSLEGRYSKDLEHKMLYQLQPYLFMDTGKVGKQAANTDISTLSSAGGGVRFKFYNDIDLSTEVAQPLKRKYMVDGYQEKSDTRFNVFLNKVFKF